MAVMEDNLYFRQTLLSLKIKQYIAFVQQSQRIDVFLKIGQRK